ncbi:MAG: hypothetical protein PF444_00785, partial [Bacteroidales bacterium]|nr:hypothetical protein [Bacteroidales bacterium]
MDLQQRIVLLFLVVFLPFSVVADDLVGYDGFSGNATGWSGQWVEGDNSNAFSLSTSTFEMTYESAAGIVIQGGDACMMATDTRSGYQSKFISRAIEGLDTTFYVSFLAQFSDDFSASWNYMAVGKKDNIDDSGVLLGTANRRNRLGAAFCQNAWKSKYTNTVGNRRPKAGQTYFMVGKWTCNSSGLITNIKLWINPTSTESERAEYSVSTAYRPNDIMSTIDLQSYADGTTYFDELRVGRTWESVVSSIVKEAVVAYSGGLGTKESPYEIATEEDLLVLSNSPTDWNKHFVQTANIIFDEDESQVDWNVDGFINNIDTKGFSPSGDDSKYFSGSYDGQSYRIKNLNIHKQKNYVGLFGMCNGASIRGINLSKVDITAYSYVGALIGYCVDNCTVDSCVTSGEVNAIAYVGGSICFISKNTVVSHYYASCNVEGNDYVGGFVGLSYLSDVSIKNSFSTGAVDGLSFVGGFAGYNVYGEIENVYSIGAVEGVYYDGGLIGYEYYGNVKNSFWDVQSSGMSKSSGGNGVDGRSTVEMKLQSTFDNWNFSGVWTIDAEHNSGYPFLADLKKAIVPVETEFIGEGDWKDAIHWTNGVPDEDEKTTAIISGDCALDEDVLIENVLVTTTGKLKVDEFSKLKTSGKLLIEADETGVGEFYVSLANLDTVMQEKFFDGGKWTFMCVPDSIMADSLFVDLKLASNWSDPDADYWIAEYSQEKRAQSGTGMVDIFDGSRMLVAGKGYMVWVYDDITEEYTHLVAKTQSQVETTFTADQAILHSGWNLVGNPFTHEMTYEDFFDCPHNQAYYTGAVYVWDGEGYVTWVGTTGDELAHVIQPMEAFFIKRTNSDEDAGYFCMQEGACAC